MPEGASTTTKRIQLKVESATPQLVGIDSAIERVMDLNRQLVAAGALAGRLSANLGGTFAGFGSSATSAASQVKRAMGDSLAAVQRTNQAIASMVKMPAVPGLGRLYAVNRSFANEGNFKAGDPQYRQEIFKGQGRTVKRSTVDNENFQYQESVNYDKFWNDAVKMGDKQRARDLKAQQLWREHNKVWADIRSQKDLQQEVVSGGALTGRGGNSQTAINAQATSAAQDAKTNERIQSQQLERDRKAQQLWREHNRKWKDIRTDTRHDRMDRDETFEERLQRIRNSGAGVQGKVDDAYRAQVKENNAANKGKGGFGFSAGMGFADKLVTAATWYSAYTAIHKVADIAAYSYQRVEQLQLQTARLSQVFRGVGGDANKVADDVLKLAAAEGRSSDEAMASAIAYSRLGLTRNQVAEATRVSLLAANVAEISAGDATQQLSAIMAGFNLQVSQLGPALGVLNQQSNSYRVTVAELMQGLSRVSGIAQQAGMSFARLTGMVTVSVQKTGQTGANMSNAIKTVLTRLIRPDVSTFLKDRFDIKATGSAEDLDAVASAYSKANDQTKRDILLKLGSATQSNRLRAILETYTEQVIAAADSVRHLNSAEEENVKITNTAAAARTRLKSSWDRFVNSPAVDNTAQGFFNNLSGIVQGFTPDTMTAKGKPMYNDPSKATKIGGLLGVANLSLMGIPHDMFRALGADEKWNNLQGRFSTPQTREQKFYNETFDIAQTAGKGEGAGLLSKEFFRIAGDWKGKSADDKARTLSALKGNLNPTALAALEGGDTAPLQAEAERLKKEKLDNLAAAKAATDALAKKKQGEFDTEKDPDKQKQIQSELNDLQGKSVQLYKEISDYSNLTAEDMLSVKEALAAQAEYATQIAGTFKGIGLSQYQEKILTLTEQSKMLAKMESDTATSDPLASAALRDRKEEAESALKAAQSSYSRNTDLAQRNAGISTGMATGELEGQGVGMSEGEKLLDRRRFLAQENGKIVNIQKMDANGLLRYEVLLNASKENSLKISQRILEVDKERRQTMLETQREFQKSLIGAGPGELLRKLAESQLAGKNGSRIRTAGQFFSLTGESQRDVYQLMGGERMASLNAEQRVLRGQGQSVSGAQASGSAIDARIMQVATEYAKRIFGGSNNVVAPAVVAQATQAVNSMTGAATRASAALGALADRANRAMNGPVATPRAPSATPVPQGGASWGMADHLRAQDNNWRPGTATWGPDDHMNALDRQDEGM